jgi:soluble lytic murein transglycosylase
MLWAPRATLAALIAATLLLSACGGEEPPPTPTPAPARAALAPTFTPTAVTAPPADAAAQPPVEPAPMAPTQAPSEPTPAPSAPAVVAAPQAEAPAAPADLAALLAEGRQLHRYGDYAAARAVFNRVAGDATATAEQRAEALYDLGRAYLGEGLYGEALATFDRLEQVVAGADPGQFAAKEQFLRADALVGTGRYADAIAAYWRFLDAYPWMSEAVQPRIAEAYLAWATRPAQPRHCAAPPMGPATAWPKPACSRRLARAQVAAGDYAAAVAAYDEILGFAQNAAYRSQVQYQAGQTLAVAGDGPGAVARWQAATAEAPEARSAYLALVELVNREVDFDLYQRGYIDIMAGAYRTGDCRVPGLPGQRCADRCTRRQRAPPPRPVLPGRRTVCRGHRHAGSGLHRTPGVRLHRPGVSAQGAGAGERGRRRGRAAHLPHLCPRVPG